MSFWSEVLSAAVSFLRFSSSALTAGSTGGGGGGGGWGGWVGTGAGGGGRGAGIGSATTADAMDNVAVGTTAAGRAGGGLALVGATRMPRTRDTSGGRATWLLATECSTSSESTWVKWRARVSRVFGVQTRAETNRAQSLGHRGRSRWRWWRWRRCCPRGFRGPRCVWSSLSPSSDRSAAPSCVCKISVQSNSCGTLRALWLQERWSRSLTWWCNRWEWWPRSPPRGTRWSSSLLPRWLWWLRWHLRIRAGGISCS